MGFKLDRVHVWSGDVEDKVGGAADKLSMLAQAGANLEYVYTRRKGDTPGTGVLYVAPITGPAQVERIRAARSTPSLGPRVAEDLTRISYVATQNQKTPGVSYPARPVRREHIFPG